MTRRALLLCPALSLLSCAGPAVDSGIGDADAGDSGAADPDGAFEPATLDPPFAHVNAIWAGVALLDFDGDGWTDIFFTNGQSLPDALYRNNGDGSFTDVAAQAGFHRRGLSGAVVSGDLDNDGDPDLVVSEECSTGSRDGVGDPLLDGAKRVWLNQGDGTFVERSLTVLSPPDGSTALVDPKQRCTVSMNLADIDGDGVLDLVLANAYDVDVIAPWSFDKVHLGVEDIVLYGDGTGDFPRTSADLGLTGSFVSLAHDIDGDGRMDLLFGTAGQELSVHLQQADGSLQQVEGLAQAGRGLWMGLALADFDGDQVLDLYATNQGVSPYMQGYDNVAETWPGIVQPLIDPLAPWQEPTLRREAINVFHSMLRGSAEGWWVEPTWPLAADQLLAGDLFDGMADGAHAQETPLLDLARQAWGWGVVALDADLDGWTDLAWVGNNCAAPMTVIWTEDQGAGPGGLLLNDGGQGFVDRTWQQGVANVDAQARYPDGRGIAVGDLNNDGRPDLVVANRTYNPSQTGALDQEPGSPQVWLSRPGQGHWLILDLVGTRSNRDGIGATVWIDGRAHDQVHAFGAGGWTNSSSERRLLVGLGDEQEVDIRVRFPSGVEVERAGVAADQVVIIEEAE